MTVSDCSSGYYSPEYEAIQQCTSVLVDTLQHCVSSATTACYSKGLISEDVQCDTLTNQSDYDNKARQLVSCVSTSIKNEAAKFDVFVEVLQADRYTEDIGKQLLDKRSK